MPNLIPLFGTRQMSNPSYMMADSAGANGSVPAPATEATAPSPEQGQSLDRMISEKESQIAGYRQQIADLEKSEEPLFKDEAEQLAYQKAQLRAGAEAYMEYDPDTATKWLQDAEMLGSRGAPRGVMSDRLDMIKADLPSKERMAQLVHDLRVRMTSDPRIDRNSQDFRDTYAEVNLINGKLNFPMSATEMDNMFKQDVTGKSQEMDATKLDRESEKQAYAAVKEQMGAVDQQLKDRPTMLGTVFEQLRSGIETRNGFAINTAVKSLIQAIDNSVVREGEWGIYQSPAITNRIHGFLNKLADGQNYTASDISQVWDVADATSRATNQRLFGEGEGAKVPALIDSLSDLYATRLPRSFAGPDNSLEKATARGRDVVRAMLEGYRVNIPPKPVIPDDWNALSEGGIKRVLGGKPSATAPAQPQGVVPSTSGEPDPWSLSQ